MPSDHTIVAVTGGPREWSTKQGGKFHAYRCTLKLPNGEDVQNVEVNYKSPEEGGKAPNQGDTIFGDLDREAQYGPKFKKASQGGGGGGGRGGGGGAWTPQREASVTRQHSQHMAILALNGLGYDQPSRDLDPTSDDPKAVEWRRIVKRLTDYFDADVKHAVKQVGQ